MSKVAIKGADTGTGIFTLESPATNTDRTLVLPDEAGTVLTTASNLTGVTGVPNNSTPILFAYAGTQNPSLSNVTFAKNTYIDTVDIDTDSAFSSSRFTVPSGKGGKYWIGTGMTYFTASNNIIDARVLIYKNGSLLKTSGYAYIVSSSNNTRHFTPETSGIFELNAGDYIEQYYYISASSPTMNVDGSGTRAVYLSIMRLCE